MDTVFVPYSESGDLARVALQWYGPWLHEIGSTESRKFAADKLRVVAAILSPHLAEATV